MCFGYREAVQCSARHSAGLIRPVQVSRNLYMPPVADSVWVAVQHCTDQCMPPDGQGYMVLYSQQKYSAALSSTLHNPVQTPKGSRRSAAEAATCVCAQLRTAVSYTASHKHKYKHKPMCTSRMP